MLRFFNHVFSARNVSIFFKSWFSIWKDSNQDSFICRVLIFFFELIHPWFVFELIVDLNFEWVFPMNIGFLLFSLFSSMLQDQSSHFARFLILSSIFFFLILILKDSPEYMWVVWQQAQHPKPPLAIYVTKSFQSSTNYNQSWPRQLLC